MRASCDWRASQASRPRSRGPRVAPGKFLTLVVEATGSPSVWRWRSKITARAGTLVLKSTFHGAAPVETWPIVVKELTVVGSRCGPFPPALALAAIGTGRPAPADFACFLLERCGGSHSLRPEARRDESVTAFAEYRVESMIGEPMKELSDKLVRVVRSAEAILLQVARGGEQQARVVRGMVHASKSSGI